MYDPATITAFIEVVDKVAEKLSWLVKSKKYNEKLIFKEVISPLFSDFEKVAEYYIRFFIEIYNILNRQNYKESSNLLDLLEEFKRIRNDTILLRLKIKAVSLLLIKHSKGKNRHIRKFAESIIKFFYGSTLGFQHGDGVISPRILISSSDVLLEAPNFLLKMSVGPMLVDLLEELDKKKETINYRKIINFVKYAIEKMKYYFIQVVQYYTALKLEYIVN